MTSLVIPSDAARARSVSRFCLFYALASLPLPVGSASPVGGGMQCAAACAPGAHPFNLETTSGEIPLSPKGASHWPSVGHVLILDQSLARGWDKPPPGTREAERTT